MVHGGFPNKQRPKELLGVVDVVASTSELDVFNRCLTTRRIRLHVVEFEEGRLIGGKPVPYVGWVFVARLPVKGPTSRKSTRAARDSAPSRRSASSKRFSTS